MPTTDELNEILVEAAKLSEFMELVRDGDEPRWWLTVDEERLLVVEADPDSGELMLTTEVLVLADLPDESHVNVLRQALSYNTLWRETGGGRMALLPEDGSLQLMVNVPAEQQEATAICGISTSLLQRAGDWASALDRLAAGAPQPDGGGSSDLVRV